MGRRQVALSFLQGSICFLVGVTLILVKWALVGICVETYGFWLLFSGFFPVVLGFLRRLPVLGRVLDLPVLKTVRLCLMLLHQHVVTVPGLCCCALALHFATWARHQVAKGCTFAAMSALVEASKDHRQAAQ